VLSILRELAADYPISAVRKPCASLLQSYQTLGAPHWQRIVELTLLRPALAWGRARSRLFLGVDRVERLNEERPATEHAVAHRIAAVGAGITEFVCHPGSLAPQFDGAAETAIVTSPTVRRAIVDSAVDLISYRDVAEGM
jgi:hypothetical protein